MEADSLQTFDVLGKLQDGDGHPVVYWLAGAKLGGCYNLQINLCDFINSKAWRASFDIDEARSNGSFEADPGDFIDWLQKGFESSGGKVVHSGAGLFVEAELTLQNALTHEEEHMGTYRFPPPSSHANGLRALKDGPLHSAFSDLVLRLLDRDVERGKQLQAAEQAARECREEAKNMREANQQLQEFVEECQRDPAFAGSVPVRHLSRSLSRSGGLKRRVEPSTAHHPEPAVGLGETQPTQEPPTQAHHEEPGGSRGVGSVEGRRRPLGQPKVKAGRGRGGASVRGHR